MGDERSPHDDTVKYLVLQRDGDFVIELPRPYKLTFAAVNPGGQVGPRDLHCLRVWERKGGNKGDELRAVFCDVRGFRDLSLPLARKITKETGAAEWTMDSAGNFERSAKRQLEEHFEEEADDGTPF
jgi:hypothetical protein